MKDALMKARLYRPFAHAALLAASLGACGGDNPTKPPLNQNPVILSVTVFPGEIGPGDSAIVVCEAVDPDAERLVYDWKTDGRLRIKDGYPGIPELYNTFTNSQVFYYNNVTPPDTVHIWCYARDDRGGSAGRVIALSLR